MGWIVLYVVSALLCAFLAYRIGHRLCRELLLGADPVDAAGRGTFLAVFVMSCFVVGFLC